MRLSLARSYERQARRHVGAVYRYSLAVLQDPAAAEEATRAVFRRAREALAAGERPRDTRAWLIAIAHGVCWWRAPRGGAAREPEASPRCLVAERTIAQDVVEEAELVRLHEHLQSCGDCRRVVSCHRAQRLAFRALGTVAPPGTLRL